MSSTDIKAPPIQRASIMLITSNEVDIWLLQSALPIIPILNSAPKRTYIRLKGHQHAVLITSVLGRNQICPLRINKVLSYLKHVK